MDLSERRVIGSIVLISSLAFLAIGLNFQQLKIVLEIVREIFRTSIAPLPV